ncbi:MAG: methyltransferase [Candidatus Nezhaarchaeota archaeon]|nr:methyltransferase [Candidatus Nezhaarchaeota archaeon]MCX8141868.1 methyltransferase [Candidatus Nezhaarchaeota archaeon]MDW8050351.1 methyltransferase [Nitrososphaerota archaeon]
MKLHLYGMTIHVWDGVYPPSDDTFLILDNVKLSGKELVLDVGTGTGILAIKYALNGCHVIGVDISKKAIRNALFNAKVNYVSNSIELLCSDAVSSFRDHCNFDVIVMNPPYLPSIGHPSVDEPSWNGGPNGTSLVSKVVKEMDMLLHNRGRLYFVTSSLSNYIALMSRIKSMGFDASIMAKKKFWFEELFLVEVKRCASY